VGLALSAVLDVKHIVSQISARKMRRTQPVPQCAPPWGWYDSIDEGGCFKVKRIQVKPKTSPCLQKHYHRAWRWIVVAGTVEIINGDKLHTLTKNQSNYILLGVGAPLGQSG
jgi:mannose-1-phosphate guanylyltransferase / mannose-6-phosphate isomerase